MFELVIKNLSIFFASLGKRIYLLIKLYFQFNIRLVHFLTSNPFGYCFYMFCVAFALFSNIPLTAYHIFCGFFFSYASGQSLQLFVLSNIPFVRAWLDDFLGKQFVPTYLGDDLAGKPFVIMLIGLALILGMEFTTLYIGQVQNRIEMAKLYEVYQLICGDPSTWDSFQKEKFTELNANIISSHRVGVISKVMSYFLK